MGKETAAVILAAGKGVRMVSRKAKALHPLCGMPLLGHLLRTVSRCEPGRTLVVVGYQADEVRAAFSDWEVEFVLQEEQRGTGHALMQVERYLADHGGEIMVLPVDTPLLKPYTLQGLMREHREKGAAASVLTSFRSDPSGYGRVIRRQDGSVEKIVEDKDATAEQAAVKEINAGVYCFASSVLFSALKEIKDDNVQKELYLTDVIEEATKRSEKVVALEADAEEVLGINDRVELARAEKVLREEINRSWMLRGVTLIDPETTYIDCEAQIGEDTVIHPGCHIGGTTVLGKGCTVMPGAVVTDSRVGQGARLGPYCIVHGICLPYGGEVGAFETKKNALQP